MTRPTRRAGYTLLEMMCVIAVLVILGAVILPTLAGMFLDTRVKAAADLVRGHAAEARTRAIEDGRSYQLFVSPDGRRIRIGPDELEQPEQSSDGQPVRVLVLETDLPDAVTLVPILIGDEAQVSSSVDGWTKLVTYRPDGSCREASAEFLLQEDGVTPLRVTIRGLTGMVNVVPDNLATGQSNAGGAPQ